jgi:hypothetical protein
MKSKIAAIITMFALTFAGPALVPTAVTYAVCNDTAAKRQVIEGVGEAGNGKCDSSGVTNIINAIVSILSYVAGIAAIIMIILAGTKYITSGGDSGKVASAKSTLIYALVGLVVAALAQFLVHFVLTTATSDVTVKPCPTGNHRSDDGKKCIPD